MKYGRFIYTIDDRNTLINVGKGGAGTRPVGYRRFGSRSQVLRHSGLKKAETFEGEQLQSGKVKKNVDCLTVHVVRLLRFTFTLRILSHPQRVFSLAGPAGAAPALRGGVGRRETDAGRY